MPCALTQFATHLLTIASRGHSRTGYRLNNRAGMSSRDSTALSSTVPLLWFRIPQSETAVSLASPSGQPELPACSVGFFPSTNLLPLFIPSSHFPSIRTAATCAGLHGRHAARGRIDPYTAPGSVPSTGIRPRRRCPRNAFIFEFNLGRSLSLSKGRRNRSQLFTVHGNTSGGYSFGSGHTPGSTPSCRRSGDE